MGMTPEQYFESFVVGSADDCTENPGCIRRAFNAAVAASHLADHYYTFNERHKRSLVAAFPNMGSYIEHVSKQTSGAFRDIRSIANAYKHLYTDVDPKLAVHCSVSSSGSIEVIDLPIGSLSEQSLKSPHFRVVFTRKDETSAEFLPLLNKVVEYWHAEIYRA